MIIIITNTILFLQIFFVGGKNIDPNWKYYSHWKNIPQSCTIIKTHKQKYENYELVSGVGAERRGDGETNLPLNTKNVIRIKDICKYRSMGNIRIIKWIVWRKSII